MEKIERLKHVSKISGAVTYLEVNHDAGTYTDDFYLVNGGHFDSKMTTKGEILRLTKRYADALGYEKLNHGEK